jgi:hypothetical protein
MAISLATIGVRSRIQSKSGKMGGSPGAVEVDLELEISEAFIGPPADPNGRIVRYRSPEIVGDLEPGAWVSEIRQCPLFDSPPFPSPNSGPRPSRR